MRRVAELVLAIITLLIGLILGLFAAVGAIRLAFRDKPGMLDGLLQIGFFIGFALAALGLLAGVGLLLNRAWGRLLTYLMAAGLLLLGGFFAWEESRLDRPIDPVLIGLICYSLLAVIVLLATIRRGGSPQ